MINLCVVCTDTDLASLVATGLRDAGATRVDVLADTDLSNLQSKIARNCYYIFIIQSPQEKLLSILPSSLSEQAFAEDLSAWYQRQSHLMLVYATLQSKSILVTHALVANEFGLLVQRVNKKWRQRLVEDILSGRVSVDSSEANTNFKSIVGNQHPFVGYLAQGLIEQTPNLLQMQIKIEKATGKASRFFDVFGAMAAYREDNQRSTTRCTELENHYYSLKAELDSAHQRDNDSYLELTKAREDGELLLTQLLQVQEELESYFLKLKDAERLHANQQLLLKTELDSVKQRNQDLSAELKGAQQVGQRNAARMTELEILYHSLKVELDSAHQRNNNLDLQLTKAREDVKLLSTQLHQVQEELESYYLKLRDAESLHANQQQSLKTELDSVHQGKQDLEAKLKDATEENELILLQLHQVQEELEHYFLNLKDAENRYALLRHRWRQILIRYPDYVDYEWVGVEYDADGQHLRWEVRSLESADVSRGELVFETFIEAGLLGVRFHRMSNAVEQDSVRDLEGGKLSRNSYRSLTRWPRVAASLDVLECIPAGRGELKNLRADVLKALSASDWALLKLIPQVVIQALDERPREDVDVERVRQAAKRLKELLDKLPVTLRYDRLSLKNHQINPDYEHLWFVFENLVFGERCWPKFELRFGASNIQGMQFSQNPKIEIPLIDDQIKPFESWFEESSDDFGGKWELRFDLKKQILDDGIWSGLQSHEQALIRGLIAELVQGGDLQLIESGIRGGDGASWERVFCECLALLG